MKESRIPPLFFPRLATFPLFLLLLSLGNVLAAAPSHSQSYNRAAYSHEDLFYADFTPSQTAVNNASTIHEDLLREYKIAQAKGLDCSTIAQFQVNIIGSGPSNSRIPNLWIATNPFATAGAIMAFNATMIVEVGLDGIGTRSAATAANTGQVQLGFLAPTPGNQGCVCTAVYLPTPFLDATGTLTNVFYKVSILPDESLSRDAIAKANAIKGVDSVVAAYYRILNAGLVSPSLAELSSFLSFPTGPFNSPLFPQLATTPNPWGNIQGAPPQGYESSLYFLSSANPNEIKAAANSYKLGQAVLGYLPPNPLSGQQGVVASAVYLWNPFKEPDSGMQSQIHVELRTLDMAGAEKDAKAKANTTQMVNKLTEALYLAEETGSQCPNPGDLWQWMTTSANPLNRPLAPEVLDTPNPWAPFGMAQKGYQQSIFALPEASSQAAKMLVSGGQGTGQVSLGYFPPFYPDGRCGALAGAVWLQTPIVDPINGPNSVFYELRSLDKHMLARDSQAKANASIILDLLSRQYYEALETGISVCGLNEFTINVAKAAKNEPYWSQSNPWRMASSESLALNPTIWAMPDASKQALAGLCNPSQLGQVQIAYLPGNPGQGTPSALATVVWTSLPIQDPVLGTTHAQIQVRSLDGLTHNLDQSAKQNAITIHDEIARVYKKFKDSGSPITQPAQFQSLIIGQSASNTQVPSLWNVINPWHSMNGVHMACNPNLVTESSPAGDGTASTALISHLGQVQIGFLPPLRNEGARLVTAVYLWEPFTNASGIKTNVFVRISNLN